jgi:hypothetical protein
MSELRMRSVASMRSSVHSHSSAPQQHGGILRDAHGSFAARPVRHGGSKLGASAAAPSAGGSTDHV